MAGEIAPIVVAPVVAPLPPGIKPPRRVQPLDYESELVSRRTDLQSETHTNLLIFPQQDITVSEDGLKYRTVSCPITEEDLQLSQPRIQLFTKDCLEYYSSPWNRVINNYHKYSGSYAQLMEEEERDTLSNVSFERDQIEAERQQQEEIDSHKLVSKSGYLLKGIFPNESVMGLSIKNYRKRWFELRGGPSAGGYRLVYYRDERSSAIKGTIHLESCTDIRPNSKLRTFGFDIVTEDDKTVYPLATETQKEMEEWLLTLGKAIGLLEEEDTTSIKGSVAAKYRSYYAKDTLRDTTKKTLHRPELLHWDDKKEKDERNENRNDLFLLYPELLHQAPLDDTVLLPLPYKEVLHHQVTVVCQELSLKLTLSRHGKKQLLEPFYVRVSLFDAAKGVKISEDFHIDFNESESLIRDDTESTDDTDINRLARTTNQALFSVSFPHPEVYIVARIEKVLQGGISTCTEPYMKPTDSLKMVDKFSKQVTSVRERLGQFRMPFAWAAKPLFISEDEVNVNCTDLGPIYRQEREKLTDTELIKILSDFKNIGRHKLQTIPGGLNVSIIGSTQPGVIFTPSYLPVKSTVPRQLTPDIQASLEVREFLSLDSYDSFSHCSPHISHINHFYVYPISLKYDTQKNFPKARNIAVSIEVRDNDTDRYTRPLKVIYSKSSDELLVDSVTTPVLYHCTYPTFYDEIKIQLPTRISRRHHLLFTFKHISCDIQKIVKGGGATGRGSVKHNNIETIVGYSWLPLLGNDGRINSDSLLLPVLAAAELPPGYLSITRKDLEKKEFPIPDGVKWVSGEKNKLIFSIKVKPDTSLYTGVPEIFTFFAICDHIISERIVSESDLKYAIESLEDLDVESLKFLPILLNRLFILLTQSFDHVEEIKLDMIKVLVSIVKEITNVNRKDLLKSYVEYSFLTTIDPISDKSVHEEIVRLLVEYVKGKHDNENQLLLYIWFFFDVIIKSIAQFNDTRHGTETDSRSELISSEFTENIEKLLLFIIIQSCNDSNDGLKGIVSVAKFIKQCFSFLDRGLVFNLIDKSIEVMDSFDTQFVSELRLDFLSYVCEHEHFVPLNLPFKTKPVLMTFYINDEYCTDHYLAGLLLREFEAALKSDNVQIRSKSIKMVRNVLAKIDFDDRYPDQEEKERISGLFFPLLTLILRHSPKLHKGKEEPPPLSPSVPPPSTPGTAPPLTPPSDLEPTNADEGTGPPSLSKKSSHGNIKLNPITGAAPGIEAINPLDVTSDDPDTDIAQPPPSPLSPPLSPGTQGPAPPVPVNSFSPEETRDLLICFLFVVKDLNNDVLVQWWQDCVDAPVPLSRTYSLSNRLEDQSPVGGAGGGACNDNEISAFFDILESCAHVFEYSGRISITKKWSSRSAVLKRLEEMYTTDETLKGKGGVAVGGARKSVAMHRSLLSARSSQSHSLIHPPTDPVSKSSLIHVQSVSTIPVQSRSASLIPGGVSRSSVIPNAVGDESVDMYITMESCLAHEVGIILLNVLELFGDHFQDQINEEHENILITKKFFSLLNTLFEVNPSSTLQHHLLSTLRGMTNKFQGALFKDSPEYCGAMCYQILKCCNSNFTTTRAEAIAVLYLLMKANFKFLKKKSFTRTGLQTTVALSKIATTTGINTSLLNLRRSLAIIVSYAENDIEVKTTSFPAEVRGLMNRLRTVLSSTALMKEHENDPEKLLDLYYSLAESYAHSPELRSTWLESMAVRHVQYGNHNEAAQCYLHIASLIIEYLKLTGRSTRGCSLLEDISINVKSDKKKIDLDDKATLDQRHTEVDLVKVLELAFTEFERGELYELMTSIFKILLPFYENDKDYKKLMDVYGRLHEGHKKIVSIMSSGKRYLGTYFRVGLYGTLFLDDHCKEFIYKEPKVTSLTELNQKLFQLYSKKFGPDTVVMIHDSGKVDVNSLDPDKVYIQITHVSPYFTEEQLANRDTQFEREINLDSFYYETPFTESGKSHGTVGSQWMRKTFLKTSHSFPYIVKRIQITETSETELSPIEVAIEAIERKGRDLFTEIEKESTDLVKLQLLLQGSITAQVNQGVQEYANVFLKDLRPAADKYLQKHIDSLKEVYKIFIDLCDRALQLYGQLASKEQSLLLFEMNRQFIKMKETLEPILKTRGKKLVSTKSVGTLPSQRGRGSKPHPFVTRTATAFIIPKEVTTI